MLETVHASESEAELAAAPDSGRSPQSAVEEGTRKGIGNNCVNCY